MKGNKDMKMPFDKENAMKKAVKKLTGALKDSPSDKVEEENNRLTRPESIEERAP
jgi:hypothetical protein